MEVCLCQMRYAPPYSMFLVPHWNQWQIEFAGICLQQRKGTMSSVDNCAVWWTHVFSKRFSFDNCACKMHWRWILNDGFGVTLQATAPQVKEESEGFATLLIAVTRATWPLHEGWHAQNERVRMHRTGFIFIWNHTSLSAQEFCVIACRPWFKTIVSELRRFLRRK
jgi:hypothetical protein